MTKLRVWRFQYPYPIQDWRNESEYPYKEKLSPSEWAWEFLRRNKCYQYDYDRYKNLQDFPEYNIVIKQDITLNQQKRLIRELKYFGVSTEGIDKHFKYQNQIGLAYRHVKLINDNEIPLSSALLKKYKIDTCYTLLNPLEDLKKVNFFHPCNDGIATLHYNPSPEGERFSIAPELPEQMVFRLSATHSIKKQIKHIEKTLRELKERLDLPKIANKPGDSYLINYIRLLDAMASKATDKYTIKEIVNKIEDQGDSSNSPNKTFNTWLDKALPLTKKDYLSLLEK